MPKRVSSTCRFALDWRDHGVDRSQTPRRFLDFIVDGESLYERLGADRITCLGWLVLAEDSLSAARLLGEQKPDVEDRVAIYVCPECADLYCGATPACIEREGTTIVGKDVATTWFGEWRHDPSDFAHLPELRFDAREYRSAIKSRPRPGAA